MALCATPPASAWDEVGSARLRVGPFPIYSCTLFTPDGEFTSSSDPVRLTLTYSRDIKAHHFVKHAKKEWEHQRLPENTISANTAKLEGAFPNIQKGESLTFETQPDGTGYLYHNGTEIFVIDDPNLAKDFVDIWLSEQTSRPKHRQRLIGER